MVFSDWLKQYSAARLSNFRANFIYDQFKNKMEALIRGSKVVNLQICENCTRIYLRGILNFPNMLKLFLLFKAMGELCTNFTPVICF